MTEAEQSRRRAEAILAVQGGKLSVTEAAERLGVSRKTYYEWEERALESMMKGLQNGSAGRPEAVKDAEKEALKRRVAELEKDLLVAKQTLAVRKVLEAYHEKLDRDRARKDLKKNRSEGRGD